MDFCKRIAFLWVFFTLVMACQSPTTTDGPMKVTAVKTQPEIGVALYSFKPFPFFETLDKAKMAGATTVEGFFFHKLGPDFDDKTMLELDGQSLGNLKSAIDEKGLNMPSIYAGGKSEAEWRQFFDIGDKLDLAFLTCEPEPEYWDLLQELGAEKQIKIAIHEHARGKSRFWHPDSVLVVLEGRSQFGVCADLGHWVRSGLDPVECLKKLEGHIIAVHAKDLDKFGDLEAQDVKISDGVIDYAAVMSELKRQNFTGPIYIECEHDFEDNVADVAFAIDYLNNPDKIKMKTIKHTVFFKLKHASGSEAEANFLEKAKALASIETIEYFELVDEVSPKNNFDFGLIFEFKDQAGYDFYNNHPDHQKFVQEVWIPEVEDFMEIDYK